MAGLWTDYYSGFRRKYTEIYSGFRRKARGVIKCRPFLIAKMGFTVLGVPCVDRGNWGRERDVIPLRDQNATFCEERFGKNRALYRGYYMPACGYEFYL